MGSRDEILNAIRSAKPDRPRTGAITPVQSGPADWVAVFGESLAKNGGVAHPVAAMTEVLPYIAGIFGDHISICSVVEGVEGNHTTAVTDDPHSLSGIDVAVVPGKLGVAENGAVWFTDDLLVQRVLPFITQHLVVILRKADIVPDMHRAYEKINMKEVRYGVFIAGPSKTADIEQSLVIGAHGARSHRVILID